MQRYSQCRNIIIDGDEFTKGILGLDWFPSSASRMAKINYENGVLSQLNAILSSTTGRVLIHEIASRSSKTMFIRPYHATPETGTCNATASPTDLAAATLRGTTALDGQGNLPAPGRPRTIGTGDGSDSVVNYNPSTFQTGSSCAVGPGATPDEILLHEMVHGSRQMAGRSVRERVLGNPNMDNYEEFVAIVVSNIYRSERGVPQLRSDHRGFNALTGPTTSPAVFRTTYSTYLGFMWVEQKDFVDGLARIGCAFNPLAP
jgi:hypothetical protein